MLEIHVSDKDATSGTVCLSWCVDHNLLQELADKGIANPFVVICIAPTNPNYWIAKEHRQVVPLKDLMAFVELHTAGKNQIRAFISTEGRKETYALLDKEYGKYSTNIINSNGDDWSSWLKTEEMQSKISQVLYVDVPEECFAPEPWDKEWVNWLFKHGSIDQCDYRRRRLMAYTVQVPMMIFNLVFRLVVSLFALLVGSRGFSLKYLLHPLTYDWESMMDNGIMSNGTVFVRRIPELGDDATGWQEAWWMVRKLCLLPLMPVILLPLYSLYRAHALWQILGIVGVIAVLFAIVAALATGAFIALYHELLDKLTSRKLWYLDKDEQDLLVCGDKKAMKLSDLPNRKKSIKLRFYDLKSRVCRPYSR